MPMDSFNNSNKATDTQQYNINHHIIIKFNHRKWYNNNNTFIMHQCPVVQTNHRINTFPLFPSNEVAIIHRYLIGNPMVWYNHSNSNFRTTIINSNNKLSSQHLDWSHWEDRSATRWIQCIMYR